MTTRVLTKVHEGLGMPPTEMIGDSLGGGEEGWARWEITAVFGFAISEMHMRPSNAISLIHSGF